MLQDYSYNKIHFWSWTSENQVDIKLYQDEKTGPISCMPLKVNHHPFKQIATNNNLTVSMGGFENSKRA